MVHFSCGRCRRRSIRTLSRTSRPCTRASPDHTAAGRKRVLPWCCDGGRRPGRVASSRISTLTGNVCVGSSAISRTRWRSMRYWSLETCRASPQVISKRANARLLIDCDPRTQDSKLTVGCALCKFYQKRVSSATSASFNMCRQEMKTRGARKDRAKEGTGGAKTRRGSLVLRTAQRWLERGLTNTVGNSAMQSPVPHIER